MLSANRVPDRPGVDDPGRGRRLGRTLQAPSAQARAFPRRGELVGIEPLGITATNDVDALLALKPDCVVYNPMWNDVDELVRILSAGVNVVASASFVTGHNLGAGRDRAHPLHRAACRHPGLLEHLDRLGWNGWVGCEYKPANGGAGGTEAGLGWLGSQEPAAGVSCARICLASSDVVNFSWRIERAPPAATISRVLAA